MSPLQFRDAIAKIGLTQAAAGVWFGRSKRTGQRWALGEYPIPDYVARFLRYMVRHKLTADDLK
jgi:hypothetical protein